MRGSARTTAALAMLNDQVKKGGLMASSFVGGLSGAFIPVSEDHGMIEAAGVRPSFSGKVGGHDLRMFRWTGYDCGSGRYAGIDSFRHYRR